jgi:hypothetical protein
VILKNPTQGIPGSMIHSKLSKNKNLWYIAKINALRDKRKLISVSKC